MTQRDLRAATPKASMKRPMRLGWLLLLGFAACENVGTRTPAEAAYGRFVEALRQQDAPRAWASLSTRTRSSMEARAKAVADASFGTVKNEPALMLFQTGLRPRTPSEVRTIEGDGGTAVLAVRVGDKTSRVRMVLEDGRWAVDLPDVLSETAKP